MENPCVKCLIMAVCKEPCNEINKFAKTLFNKTDYGSITTWLCEYEVRPRILELYSVMRRKYQSEKSL